MLLGQIFGVIVLLLLVVYLVFIKRAIEIRSADFAIIIVGVILGLSIGALISLPLGKLEGPFAQWLPLIINVFSVAVVTTYFYSQRANITKFFSQLLNFLASITPSRKDLLSVGSGGEDILLDTSAIIDGRILEIVRTGFLSGKLLVPKFVLTELQNIADSPDDLRRSRGRRGLDILNELRREKIVQVVVIEDDFPSELDVDAKIVRLAKKRRIRLMTVDYNLNRVANIQGITVMNVNELNNALRPVVLPGEKLQIKLVQEGKDRHQGVGYLDDGTMVVVENGNKLIGQEVKVMVTRVFQTVAGKMIFAAINNGNQK
ncbi:TRAM domain-containing protein [Patescibacteria group bacterium]|nr:TRAM domain-containing protein [Patescibacteria group bacterium]